MQRGFAAEVPRVEHLEEIELAAAGGPAAARRVGAVLRRARDLRVEDPERGHVCGEAGLAGVGHEEFEEEDFLGARESV